MYVMYKRHGSCMSCIREITHYARPAIALPIAIQSHTLHAHSHIFCLKKTKLTCFRVTVSDCFSRRFLLLLRPALIFRYSGPHYFKLTYSTYKYTYIYIYTHAISHYTHTYPTYTHIYIYVREVLTSLEKLKVSHVSYI